MNIVVMFFVALLLFGGGAYFFVVAQATPVLYTGFMIAAAAFVPGGFLFVVLGIVKLRRRKNAQRQPG